MSDDTCLSRLRLRVWEGDMLRSFSEFSPSVLTSELP